MRHLALNPLKSLKDTKLSVRLCRMRAAWNQDFLLQVLMAHTDADDAMALRQRLGRRGTRNQGAVMAAMSSTQKSQSTGSESFVGTMNWMARRLLALVSPGLSLGL